MTSVFTPPHTSWTHRLTRVMVRPLVGSAVTPNHLTTARLLTGIAGGAAFAIGSARGNLWGGVLWIVSCLLDRADGELARLGKLSSPAGHLYDYYCDVAVNSLVFIAISIGLCRTGAGWGAPALGVVAAAGIALASILSEKLEHMDATAAKAYAGVLGFDFDDALYLLAPLAWLGWLAIVLVGGAIAGPIFAALTAWRVRRKGTV